jgi:hypothetical protein
MEIFATLHVENQRALDMDVVQQRMEDVNV